MVGGTSHGSENTDSEDNLREELNVDSVTESDKLNENNACVDLSPL